MPAAEKEAQYAVSRDPTYARAYLWLARVQMITVDEMLLGHAAGHTPAAVVRGGDHQATILLRETAANYRQAMQLGVELDPGDRLKYTTALALTGDDALFREGQPLRGTPESRVLAQRLAYFCQVKGEPGKMEPMIRRLRQPAPAPVMTSSTAESTSENNTPLDPLAFLRSR